MNLPKTQRNIRIWLEKDGLENEDSTVSTKLQKTYRQLSFEYGLSIPRLLVLINRERKRHEHTLAETP